MFPPYPALTLSGTCILNCVGGVVLFISILASSSLPQHLDLILLWLISAMNVPKTDITIETIDKI